MELVTADGSPAAGPAPMLAGLRVDAAEADALWHAVRLDIRCLLECGLVHGGLSAYNILYADGVPRLIDLPQCTPIAEVADPWPLFYRDVANICDFFTRRGVATVARTGRNISRRETPCQIRSLTPRYA